MKLIKLLILCAFSAFWLPASASEAKIQVINFTAEWCPVCRVFDPNLHTAIDSMGDREVEWLSIDLTVTRTGSQDEKSRFWIDFFNEMRAADLMVVHSGYNGYPYTGYAVVLASDTKEVLVCMAGAQSSEQIGAQLKAAIIRVKNLSPGKRVPEGPDCPPSFL